MVPLAPEKSGPFWRVLDFLRDAVLLLRVFGIPLGISAVASIILTFPEQTREYYRLLLENYQVLRDSPGLLERSKFLTEVMGSAVAVVLMAASIAIAARALEVAHRQEIDKKSRVWRWMMRWTPIALGSAPIFALSYGLFMSADVVPGVDRQTLVNQLRTINETQFADTIDELFGWIENYNDYLRYASIAVAAAGVGFVLCAIPIYGLVRSGETLHSFALRALARIMVLFATVTAFVLVHWYPVALPQALGSVGVFALFVALLALNAAMLHLWTRQSGVPLIGVLVAGAMLFSALDWNDNHELRRIDQTGKPITPKEAAAHQVEKLPSAEEKFLAWYDSRPDKNDQAYTASRYPIYIVAAQGGGMYTAAQVLMFLVKMQASCERFSQHLFAISGVSGGAVGATLYSVLADTFRKDRVDCVPIEKNPRQMSQDMRESYLTADNLLLRDYLSPLIASALFPDFLQRFLPVAIPELSRARALENAFEQSWNDAVLKTKYKPDALAAGMFGSWDPKLARPALVLNTTEAGSGRRRVIAPFSFATAAGYDLQFLPIDRDYDVPLSAAAIASARFPWLTPAAWFGEGARGKVRVVDGAYFENSGVATAMDLIFELERIADKHALPVEFHLVVMTSGGFSMQTFYGFGELFAPIQSLLNARHARTLATIDLADRELGPIGARSKYAAAPPPVRRLQRVEINNFLTPLPFGWRLSRASVFQIDRQTGLLGHCIPDEQFRQKATIAAFTTADCVKQLIYHQLRGDDIQGALQAARHQ